MGIRMESKKSVECGTVIKSLEQLCAPVFAENWDNVGLLAGRRDKEVGKICIALDATDAVVEEAVRKGADMLLTHHPLIFSSMKKINTDDFIGKTGVAGVTGKASGEADRKRYQLLCDAYKF